MGSVMGPTWIPAQYACNGDVTIRFFRGLKQVGFTLAGIQPNCTFTGSTVFNRSPGAAGPPPGHAASVVRSNPNNYLEPQGPERAVELG